MFVNERDNQGIIDIITEVITSVNIKVGTKCRIHPSYGYAGIESGIVQVTRILLPGEDDKCLEMANQLLDFGMVGLNEDEMQQATEEIMDNYWVAYKYTSVDNQDDELLNTLQYLPLDDFVYHRSGM